jgi:hypothetical protein
MGTKLSSTGIRISGVTIDSGYLLHISKPKNSQCIFLDNEDANKNEKKKARRKFQCFQHKEVINI